MDAGNAEWTVWPALSFAKFRKKTRIARDTMKKVTETVRELALPVVEENG